MTADQHEELTDALQKLQDAFATFDWCLKHADRHLWERWNAGGKAVSDDFVSMYPTASECVDKAEVEEEPEEVGVEAE